MNSRRDLLSLLLATGLLPTPAGARPDGAALSRGLARLEARAGGRLGVAVLDTGSGVQAGHRAGERFGLCSTFKLLLAAAVLQRCDQGRMQADQFIAYGKADLVPHAPVTGARLAEGGMKLLELAEATQITSDNPAANLLLRQFGGPAGFTAWLREIGDTTTRIDRWEPEMNRVPHGEERDTSTPAAIAATTARLLTGTLLQPASRERLLAWMEATRTGSRRLRAGFPAGWRAGDKTGTAMSAAMADKINDVAIVWPAPERAPIVVAAYYEGPRRNSERTRPEDEAVLAEVGKLVSSWAATPPPRR